MTLPAVDPEIGRRVQQTLDGYGKIGLLIDDAPEARSRAARSIYGAEALPEWWLVGRSLTCARSLLSALREELEARPNLLVVVVVDRYLLVSCDQQSSRLVPWDVTTEGLEEDGHALCEELNDIVSWLDQRNRSVTDHLGLFLEMETSYPHGFSGPRRSSERRGGGGLPWKTRSTDLLYRLRGRIQERGFRTLLRYGPSEQLVAEVKDPEFSWRARTWRSTLDNLVQALRQQTTGQPVILLTGAGASRRVGRLSCGMPSTDQLLQKACWQIAERNKSKWPDREAPPEPNEARCTCEASAQPESSEAREVWKPRYGSPVEWLVSHVASGGSVDQLDWSLEQLFSVEMNGRETRQRRWLGQFYNAFRAALHRHDHGFPYHHWLLAQLPWTRIITTNFDGFHERAAAAAVAARPLSEAKRDHTLSLGSPLPLETGPSSPQLREGRRLSKTHGSLLFPAELELGLEQLQEGQERLQRELEALLESAGQVWLVVVGHSMRDIYIDHLQAFRARQSRGGSRQRIRLVWVVPEALQRCEDVTPSAVNRPRVWDRWMSTDWNQGRGESGPFPAKVSEFAYDLWQLYHNDP